MDCASCPKFLSQNSEFGCGFLVFGCFTRVCNVLGLFLMFGLGLRVLQYGAQCKGLIKFLEFKGKSFNLINGFCSKNDFGEGFDSKASSCKCNMFGLLRNFNPPNMGNVVESRGLISTIGDIKAKDLSNEELDGDDDGDGDGDGDGEGELDDECEEFDVMTLRKLIKMELRRANATHMELEKERMAAASAAEEAMAMILRLQNEKSSIEIEAHQYRRMAEQKQLYDQEVIQLLRWMVMKHESQRSLLEAQLTLCRQKLKLYVKADEFNGLEGADANMSFFSSTMEDSLGDVLLSSLDMDSPLV
ncbi:hypothetical protein L1049_015542 [Liquidambar formosana]|uniref:GTD-binding domain-containing protein n=1 Tax=Liquidambar formosana TaxID=63359 RepID=A0AAP0S3U0_LIQFO